VTGDEKFFYARQIGHKKSYASWVNEGEAPRTIVNREQSDLKWLFTIFFKSSGILHVSHLDRGDTIDYSYYIRNNLSPLVAAIKSQRPLSGLTNMKFHHDNARPHVHKSVKIYLESKGFTVMRHPPYSPDLAPSDFWLFDYIQTRLSDHPDVESLHKQITEIVKNIPEAEYQKTFQKWIERMEYCIEYRGEYFEHLLK
jgi:histone-lysine N-methyltransferase SETMAR